MVSSVDKDLLARLPERVEPSPIVLLLHEAGSRFVLNGVPDILDMLYKLSCERSVLFPFASSFLETIDRIMDPIVAKHGCAQQGVYYLADVPPFKVVDLVLQRWEACRVVSDESASHVGLGGYRAVEQGLLNGTSCHWILVSGKSHIVPKVVRGVLPAEELREAPPVRHGVLSWLG